MPVWRWSASRFRFPDVARPRPDPASTVHRQDDLRATDGGRSARCSGEGEGYREAWLDKDLRAVGGVRRAGFTGRGRPSISRDGNPKLEARNPKQLQYSNCQARNVGRFGFRSWNFGFSWCGRGRGRRVVVSTFQRVGQGLSTRVGRDDRMRPSIYRAILGDLLGWSIWEVIAE